MNNETIHLQIQDEAHVYNVLGQLWLVVDSSEWTQTSPGILCCLVSSAY